MENLRNDQENSPKSSEDIDIVEAQRIEIKQLKKELAYLKSMLAELKERNSDNGNESLFHSSKCENVNASVNLQGDLYKFAGMHCVKLDTASVFQFLSGYKVTKNDIYAVEILKIDGYHQLGRWVMPMSIDLRDLILEYPLENPKNIKPFLKCCKHHIDCYNSRREQYYQLKEFLSDVRNCFLDTTLGYLQVHLHMSGIKMIDSGRIYNIGLYMGYDSDRAFPSKMATELREGKMLPPEVVSHFSKYFKPFKKQELREAFEKVISDTRFFQWTKESYDHDESALLTDDKLDEGEHDEEELDELDATETSRKLYKRKDSKKKNIANDLNNELTGLEGRSNEEKSLSSEEKEERSKPNRNVNETRAKETANAKARKKSKRTLNLKTNNVNITKYLKRKVKSTTEENSNAIEEKTMEKLKDNSQEGENLKERENSRERENSIVKENSKENEDEQMDRTDTMINPSVDVRNDNIEISNDGSDKTGNEVEKNVSLNKTPPLSKSSEQIETKLVGKSKKGKGAKKSMNRKSNVNNLSIKSATSGDVARNDKESTMIPTIIPTNVYRNNIISSTPISGKLQAKLYTSHCSQISEISTSPNAKSKKDHRTVNQDIPNENIPEEDAVSSSISDDIGEEDGYEEAKELLKDIQNVLAKDEVMKNNIQRNVKKMKKKKKGKAA